MSKDADSDKEDLQQLCTSSSAAAAAATNSSNPAGPTSLTSSCIGRRPLIDGVRSPSKDLKKDHFRQSNRKAQSVDGILDGILDGYHDHHRQDGHQQDDDDLEDQVPKKRKPPDHHHFVDGEAFEDFRETSGKMGNLTERRPHPHHHHSHHHLSLPWRPVLSIRPPQQQQQQQQQQLLQQQRHLLQGPSSAPTSPPGGSSPAASTSTSPRFPSDDEASETATASYIGPHGKKQRTRLIGSESSWKDDEVAQPGASAAPGEARHFSSCCSSPPPQPQQRSSTTGDSPSPKSTNSPAQPPQQRQEKSSPCSSSSTSRERLAQVPTSAPTSTPATTGGEYFFGIQDPLRKRRSLPAHHPQQRCEPSAGSLVRYHRISLGSVVITASPESPQQPLNLSRNKFQKDQQDGQLCDGEAVDDDDHHHERHRRSPPLNLTSLARQKAASLLGASPLRSSVIVPNMPSFGDYFPSVSQPLVAQQPPSTQYQPSISSTSTSSASSFFSNPTSLFSASRQGIRKPGRPRKYIAGDVIAAPPPPAPSSERGIIQRSLSTSPYKHHPYLVDHQRDHIHRDPRSSEGTLRSSEGTLSSMDLPSFGSSDDPIGPEDDTPDSTATSSSGSSSTKTNKSESGCTTASGCSGTPEAKSKKKSKDYYCDKCDRWFSQLRNYRYHMSRHEGTFIFACTCPECGKRFNDKGYLSSHMKIHRNLKEYVCEYCGKSFNQRVAYNMHTRIHTGLKPHQCKQCPKAFSRKMLLRQHERTHTGERPFHCSVCDKSFADRSNMLLHERLHTGERPYKCSQCGKAFSKNHHLKTHMNHHLGIRPYQCPQCHATFTQSSNMKTHMKKCSGTLHLTGGGAPSTSGQSPTAMSPQDRKLLVAGDTKSFSGLGTTSGGIIMEPARSSSKGKFEEHDIVYQVNPAAAMDVAQLEHLAASTTSSLLRSDPGPSFYTSSPRSDVPKPLGSFDYSPVKRGRPRKTQPSATITSMEELHQQSTSGFEPFREHQPDPEHYLKSEPSDYFNIPSKPAPKTSPLRQQLPSPSGPSGHSGVTYGKMAASKNLFPSSDVSQIVYDCPASSPASFSTTSTDRNFSAFDFGQLQSGIRQQQQQQQQTFQPSSSVGGGGGASVLPPPGSPVEYYQVRGASSQQQQPLFSPSSGYQQQQLPPVQQLRGASEQQPPQYSSTFLPPASDRFSSMAPPPDFPEIRNVAQFFEEQRIRPPHPSRSTSTGAVQLSPRIPTSPADARFQLHLHDLAGFVVGPPETAGDLALLGGQQGQSGQASPQGHHPHQGQQQQDPFYPRDTFK